MQIFEWHIGTCKWMYYRDIAALGYIQKLLEIIQHSLKEEYQTQFKYDRNQFVIRKNYCSFDVFKKSGRCYIICCLLLYVFLMLLK